MADEQGLAAVLQGQLPGHPAEAGLAATRYGGHEATSKKPLFNLVRNFARIEGVTRGSHE